MTMPRRLAALLGIMSLFLSGTAFAAAPTISSGVQLNTASPYLGAQTITNIFANKGVYGKLQGTVPFDLYKFTAERDGEQTFTVLLPKGQPTTSALAAVFVDSTQATQGTELGLPTPSAEYHTSVLTQSSTASTVTDMVLFRQYHIVSQQRIALQKGKTYYLWVLDPQRQATRYAVTLGTGAAWSSRDFFSSFAAWWHLETDSYAGSSPFKVAAGQIGLSILLLGLLMLVGTYLIQQIFALASNRRPVAGFLLIKLQPYSRIIIWLALWFLAIGGYIFFNTAGWIGIPFVLLLLFILVLITFLYETVLLSPRVARLEVVKDEAALPLTLRKSWFFIGFIEAILLIAAVVLLAMYLSASLVK